MYSIDALKDGFRSFRGGMFPDRRATYETLVDEGQHPRVCVVSCSDSRIDPEIVLQADPGDLFVIRNVANLVPPYVQDGSHHGTSAALEYAVEHLEVAHIIVLGHAYCGGIGALVKGSAEGSTDRFIGPWVRLARAAYLRVQGTMPQASDEEKLRMCEKHAVLVSLENLMTFPAIRQRVADGRLLLHGWYVDIRNCELFTYDANVQRFEPVK